MLFKNMKINKKKNEYFSHTLINNPKSWYSSLGALKETNYSVKPLLARYDKNAIKYLFALQCLAL